MLRHRRIPQRHAFACTTLRGDVFELREGLEARCACRRGARRAMRRFRLKSPHVARRHRRHGPTHRRHGGTGVRGEARGAPEALWCAWMRTQRSTHKNWVAARAGALAHARTALLRDQRPPAAQHKLTSARTAPLQDAHAHGPVPHTCHCVVRARRDRTRRDQEHGKRLFHSHLSHR